MFFLNMVHNNTLNACIMNEHLLQQMCNAVSITCMLPQVGRASCDNRNHKKYHAHRELLLAGYTLPKASESTWSDSEKFLASNTAKKWLCCAYGYEYCGFHMYNLHMSTIYQFSHVYSVNAGCCNEHQWVCTSSICY